MIESSFEEVSFRRVTEEQEAFSKEWVETQITDSTNELVILRDSLASHYRSVDKVL